jgi:orotidine 5'-phosphate decarboxylase subfamily 2
MLCFGMDPVLQRMKIDSSKNLADEIAGYFMRILEEISKYVAAVKPNVAYYLQYGTDGMKALSDLIIQAKKKGLPVIIDLKAGDIGRTSAAYARFVFEILDGDALTVNPYMGYDAIEPFLHYTDKGFYVLALTSNPGSMDFQNIELKAGGRLFDNVIEKICGWSQSCESIGAVVGATGRDFKRCIAEIVKTGRLVPLLIPGVGAQGGSYGEVKKVLDELGYDTGIVRINVSSSLSYAYERYGSVSYTEAALMAAQDIVGMS